MCSKEPIKQEAEVETPAQQNKWILFQNIEGIMIKMFLSLDGTYYGLVAPTCV